MRGRQGPVRRREPWGEAVAGEGARGERRRGLHTSLQYLVTATPKGCSLQASAVPTTARSFLSGSVAGSTSSRTRMTLGAPWVMVPVLSNITVFICQDKHRPVATCAGGRDSGCTRPGDTFTQVPQAGSSPSCSLT